MSISLNNYTNIIFRYTWALFLTFPILVILMASFNLSKLGFDESWKIWYTPHTLEKYDAFVSEFIYDDAVVIVFKDDDGIFNRKALASIKRLTDKINKVRYVRNVLSLTSYQHISSGVGEDILIQPYILDPDDPIDIENKKVNVKKNTPLVRRLISEDLKFTMIIARLSSQLLYIDQDKSHEIKNDIDHILRQENMESGYDFHVYGGPELTVSFEKVAIQDIMVFVPLILILIVLFLFIIFRSIHGVLLPLSVVMLTTLATLTFEVLLGHKLNNFTINIPLFIIAISLADTMHILSVHKSLLIKGHENIEAIRLTLRKILLPLFLTSLTTGIGFLSLQFSPISPVQYLGGAIAFSVMFAFILSVTFTPAYLLLLEGKDSFSFKWLDNIFTVLPDVIKKYHKSILLLFSIVTLFSLYGLSMLKIDSNLIKYFHRDTEIRQTILSVQNNITGPVTYELILKSGKDNGIYEPEFLNEVDRFSQELYRKYPEIRLIYSMLDIIKQLNRVMNYDDQAYFSIPDDRELIAQYLLLYEMSLAMGSDLQELKNYSNSALRLTANVDVLGTSKDLEIIGWVEQWWSQSRYEVEVTGSYSLFAKMQRSVTNTLLYSLVFTFIFLVVILIPLLNSPVKWLLYLVPNILPIMLVFGLMGWLGFPIDLGIAISSAIILSISIDDSLHFLLKYFYNKGNTHDSVRYAFKYAGKPMLYTSIIVSVSFGLLGFSNFTPNMLFGITVASGLMLALVIDLVLLPALIYFIDEHRPILLSSKNYA